jgi:transposase
MSKDVTLTQQDQKRLMVLTRVMREQVTMTEAAELLELSERQVRRLLAAYERDGVAGLVHGNRGRQPAHTTAAAVRQRVQELAQTTYASINHQHLTELLADREGIVLSCSTVKRILQEAGIRSPKTRRGRQHRSRRQRYAQEGMLLQLDGSRHTWLEGRGPKLTLIAGIDDATGTVPAALFREQEDAQGYLLLLQEVVQTKGRPAAVYHDRHGIFGREDGKPTLERELEGIQQEPTQVERVLQDLQISSIAARSPQAKGRIERLFGTFQDRLVTELRLAGASTMAEATAVLADFLPRFNQRFAVPAAQEGSAYRPLAAEVSPTQIFCFKYRRTVGSDNTIRFGQERIQLLPAAGRVSFAKCRVEVQERLDGSLGVYYQGTEIASRAAPAEAPVLRAKTGRGTVSPEDAGDTIAAAVDAAAVGAGDMWTADRSDLPTDEPPRRPHIPSPRKPAADHPWRKPLKTATRT